jgi:type IV secretory pathway protease TraF
MYTPAFRFVSAPYFGLGSRYFGPVGRSAFTRMARTIFLKPGAL